MKSGKGKFSGGGIIPACIHRKSWAGIMVRGRKKSCTKGGGGELMGGEKPGNQKIGGRVNDGG